MKSLILLLLFLFFTRAASPQNTDTLFYSVVKTGIISGEQKTLREGLNDYKFFYQYNDRGRGDSIYAEVKTNNEGLIVFLNATGVNYFKNPYTETFEIIGDSAIWSVNEDRKAKKFNNELYNTFVVPGIVELQVNWLLKQTDKKANTLPEGSIHTENPLLKEIHFDGKSAAIKLYAIYYDTIPIPEYVWFTNDDHFFGYVNNWYSVIKTGYEKWTDTLLALQEEADQKYYSLQMKEFSRDLPQHLLITHANVFQSSDATVNKDMSVEVVEGKITDIYPSSENKNIKADTVIDASGKFLMPGLWDMHSHYQKYSGAWYLAGGVTHVRDMGNANILLSYKQQIASNQLLGPDISYVSAFIDKQGPYQGPTGKIISSLEEAIESINEFSNLGYDQLKIYSSIEPLWVPAMCAEAHKLGMQVCGHIPAFMTAENAIKDGYDEITHMNFIFLNFLSDTIDTRTPLRFRAVGDNAGNIDLQGSNVQSFIGLMKEKNVSLDATMNLFATMFSEFAGDTTGSFKPIINWLPDYMRTNLSTQNPFGSEDKKEAYRSSYKNMLKMLKIMYDNGVTLLAGTDGGEAIALHHELEIYVQAGIPSNEVLKIATYNAAKNCKLENIYGEIKINRAADFILIDGNPVENISDIRRVEWVIKNGKLYNPKQLLASQGWKYYY